MHVPCRLREVRGTRTLQEIADRCGIARGTLSLIETGRLLPRPEQIPALEDAYGVPLTSWYPPGVLAVCEGIATFEAVA